MKRWIIILPVLVLLGCEISDPDGTVQLAAQDVNEALVVAKDVVTVTPVPSPLKETILGVIALAGAVVGAVQAQKKKRADTTTEQIVRGVDDAIKSGAISVTPEFTTAMNAAQDTVTRSTVNKLQGKD